MPGALLKSFVSTFSIIINGSLFATLLSRSFQFSADNVMLLHYFAYNIISNSFRILGNPYCSLNGYGEELSNLGSTLAFMLITYRFTALSRLSSFVWIMLINAPVLFLGFLALQDEGTVFVFSNLHNECIKGTYNSMLWTSIISAKIFLVTLTLLLAIPASWMIYSNTNNLIEKKRHAMLHLLTSIIFDSFLSGIYTMMQLLTDSVAYQKVSHTILYTLSSIRLILIPLFLLLLHSGIRNTFLQMLGYTQRLQNNIRPPQPLSIYSRVQTQGFQENAHRALKKDLIFSFHSIDSDLDQHQPKLHNANSVELLREGLNQMTRGRTQSNSRLKKESPSSEGSIIDMNESLKVALNPHANMKMAKSTEF